LDNKKNIIKVKLILTFFLSLVGLNHFNAQNLDSLLEAFEYVTEKSKICNEIAEVYKQDSKFTLTKTFADSALHFAIQSNNSLEKGNAYLNLGDYNYYISNYDSSIIYYQKAVTIYIKLNDSENIASAYSNIGAVYYSKSEFKEAIKNFKKAANYQKITNNKEEVAIIYNNIATVYYQINNNTKAIEYYKKSLALKKDKNESKSIAKGLNNIANVYGEIGDYDKSIQYYYDAIRYCDKSNDKPLKATTLNNIAGVYKDWKQYDKALELYNEALNIKIELKDLDGKANVLNNIGLIKKLKEDYKDAELKFLAAKEIFEQIGNKDRLAIVCANLGALKEHEENYSDAIVLYAKSLEISKEIERPYSIALGNLNLSRVYLTLGKLDLAEQFMNECLVYFEEYNLNSIELEIYQLLSELYQKKGVYKTSLRYYKKYSTIKDSLFSAEKHKKLNEINTQYETEKKNKEIELLYVESKKQELEIKSKNQERNFWLGISIFSILIGAISIYFFVIKKKLSERLEHKNKIIEKTLGEKDVLMREIHHRVKNNLQIISSLLNMQSRYLSDDKSKAIVADSQNRIKSMSLIHQKLYQEDNLTGIDTKTYFTELIDGLCLSYGLDNEKLNFKIDIERLFLDVDTLIPLGLMLNEILTNAFKYGVDKEHGEFTFIFSKEDENLLRIFVKDNGDGIPDGFELKKSKSYGMKLIQSLSKKLKTDVSFNNNNGLEITMLIRKFRITK